MPPASKDPKGVDGIQKEQIIADYSNIRANYEMFANKVEHLLRSLVEVEGIKVHIFESRAKTVESFAEKISRPGKKYMDPLNEIGDLAGLRLIVFYEDDVGRVGELLGRQFKVYETEGVHQVKSYDPDRFGYLSMHYVVGLNEARVGLPEWGLFGEYKVEVQVRSLLQHSWAVISHALQYKRESDVQVQLRRRLFRLAGLFEIADEEFIGIRDSRDKIVTAVREDIAGGNMNVSISMDSLRIFISQWSKMDHYKKYMEKIGYDFDEDSRSDEYISQMVEMCEDFGICTLGELEGVMEVDMKAFLKKARDGPWEVDDAFAFNLMFIRANAGMVEASRLIEGGWSDEIAERVVSEARKDAGLSGD